MVTPAAGAVVLVRFPFSDLSKTKLRHARPGKLFTASLDFMLSEVATLKSQSLKQVVDAVISLLRAGNAS